ncbi:MAG: hypothetical protein ABIQ04_02750 [Candidatus Saccharimonadales bacterium]
MHEKSKQVKHVKKHFSFWMFYWIALPLATIFMIFEILQVFG